MAKKYNRGIKATIRSACWGVAQRLNTNVEQCCPRWLINLGTGTDNDDDLFWYIDEDLQEEE